MNDTSAIADTSEKRFNLSGNTRKARVFFNVVFTLVENCLGAPFIDKCAGWTAEGKHWTGHAIQLNPFRFNRYGDRKCGLCLCIGLIR